MMRAFELFCGAGGTSFGFSQTGQYDIVGGIDIDSRAIETFLLNHPGSIATTGDITQLNHKKVVSELCIRNIDVLIGGPSCQGYSTIGKRLAEDPRNTLFVKYLDYLDEIKPRWFVFENVKGFVHCGQGKFFKQFVNALQDRNYQIAFKVINAADYGVPQRRERLIIIGTNTGLIPSIPMPTHQDPRCPACSRPDKSNRLRVAIETKDCKLCSGSGLYAGARSPWVSVRDAIGCLEDVNQNQGTDSFVGYNKIAQSDYASYLRQLSLGYTLHKGKAVSKYALSIISKIPEGKGIRSIQEDDLPERFQIMRKVGNGSLRKDCTTLYGRLAWDLPSYTITCYFRNVSSGAFTHPVHNRALTLREGARLQSFPDRFIFSRNDVTRQIGNAVPPILAKAIASHIIAVEKGSNFDSFSTEPELNTKQLSFIAA